MNPRSPSALDFDVAIALRGIRSEAKVLEDVEDKMKADAAQVRGVKNAEDLMGARRH